MCIRDRSYNSSEEIGNKTMRRQTQDVSCDDEISSPAQCVKELNKIRNTLRENTISAIVSQMWDNPAVGMKTPNEDYLRYPQVSVRTKR